MVIFKTGLGVKNPHPCLLRRSAVILAFSGESNYAKKSVS